MRQVFALLVLSTTAVAAPIAFVELQPVIVQGAVTDAALADDITYAQAIFAQIGLNVEVFSTLYSSTLPATMDQSSASALQTYVLDSTFRPFPILTAWYVSSITGPCCGIRGVSFSLTDGTNDYYGIGVATSHAPDTLADEIAHILHGVQRVVGTRRVTRRGALERPEQPAGIRRHSEPPRVAWLQSERWTKSNDPSPGDAG